LHTLRSLWEDRLLRGIVKNSGYLFSSNSAAAVLSFFQGILAIRLLGDTGFGLLAGVIIPFASNIQSLLSFRMSELVVKYVAQFLAQDRKDRAAAVVKGALMVESLTSITGFTLLLLLAPLAAVYFAKDVDTSHWFILYGFVLLSNLVYESSLGVLHAARQFKLQALANLGHSLITFIIIVWAYLNQGGLWEVLLAFLLGKSFAGLWVTAHAVRQAQALLGPGWWKVSLNLLPERREMFRFAISTNLNQTINLIARNSETLLIAFLRSPVEAGYYRLALSLINLIMTPIDPFISATYAEITRTIARHEWANTLRVLKRVSLISGAWTVGTGLFLLLFGWWLIPFVYTAEFLPTYPAVIILLVGYGFANTFNWNRPLLLALGLPDYPIKVTAAAAAVKTVLVFALVGTFGYLMQAVLLTLYFLVSVSLILRRGLSEMSRRASFAGAAALAENPNS
jgi:O-antigen/teichoic acid export membrane protein